MKHVSLRLAVLSVLGLSSAVSAYQLSPVVVSASPIHAHEAFEVPTQVDVMMDENKREQERASLGHSLQQIVGVNNQTTGVATGKPVIRGLTGERIKVLVGGSAQDYQAYGEQHGAPVEPYLAERIEVIRGAQGVLYGSEAMGGVVNVLPMAIRYSPDGQTHRSGELASEYNTNNQEWMLGAKGRLASDTVGLSFGLAVRQADNFRSPSGTTAVNDTNAPASSKPLYNGETPYTNFENQAFELGLGYRPDWGQVEARFRHFESKQNFLIAHEHDDEFETEGSGQIMLQNEFQLSAEIPFNQAWLFKPSWTHTQHQREESHDKPFEKMGHGGHGGHGHDHDDLDLRVTMDQIRLALVHPKFGLFEGEVGVELMDKTQKLKSGHLVPSATETQKAVYLFEEADFDRWLLQFGARYDVHQIKASMGHDSEHFWDDMGIYDASNNQRDFSFLTGAVGAAYRLTDQWIVAANLGQGYRAPSIFELYAGGTHGGVNAFQRGNPDLKAETSINADLSLRWQTEQTQMNATVYQNTISNYIYLERTGESVSDEGGDCLALGVTCYDDMRTTQTDGVIHGFEWQLAHQFNRQWSMDTALELIQGRDSKNSQDLALIPANNLKVNLHYALHNQGRFENQRVSLGVKAVDKRKSAGDFEPFGQYDDMPIGTSSTEAYHIWNLGYQTQVALDKNRLSLGVQVENLFDTAYRDFLDTYKGFAQGQGRNLRLTASLSF